MQHKEDSIVDLTTRKATADEGVRVHKVRGQRRKIPTSVTGPHVVYMLRDEEIMEDLSIIRKAAADKEERERKKREAELNIPKSVTGPYIVYMLREEEIMEDLAIIRKAVADKEEHERKEREAQCITIFSRAQLTGRQAIIREDATVKEKE